MKFKTRKLLSFILLISLSLYLINTSAQITNPKEYAILLPDATSFSKMTESTLFKFDPNSTSTLIGSGYDSISSEIRGDCVDRSEEMITVLGDSMNTSGQSTTYDFRQAATVSELRKELNIDANASFGIGIYSGSASAHFFESSANNSLSSYLIVDVTVINQTETLSKKKLTEFAKGKLADHKKFRRACGDLVVISRRTGGKFTAIVRFSAKSEEYKRQMDATLSAKVSSYYSGSINFHQMLASLSTASDFNINIIRKGDHNELPNLNLLDNYAREFPKMVDRETGSPWPIEIITTDYDTVEGYDSDERFDNSIARDTLELLANARDIALLARNDIVLALINPEAFGDINKDAAIKDQSILNNYLNQLSELAHKCAEDTKNCSKNIPALPTTGSLKPQPSDLGKKITEAEELFEARGNFSNAMAPIKILAEKDFSGMSLRDQYRAAILLIRTYLWQEKQKNDVFRTPHPLPSNPILMGENINAFRVELKRATTIANKLSVSGQDFCEARYFAAIDAYIKRPLLLPMEESRFFAETPSIIAKFEALRTAKSFSKKTCEEYDGFGIDRHVAELNDDMAKYYSGFVHDQTTSKVYWEKAFANFRRAYNGAPTHPTNAMNFPVFTRTHMIFNLPISRHQEGCMALRQFILTPSSGADLGLEPAYGKVQAAARKGYPVLGCEIVGSLP